MHEGPVSLSMKGTGDREKHGFKGDFTAEDFWFSAKDNTVYVTSLKWPESKDVLVKSITQLPEAKQKGIRSVQMLGSKKNLSWKMRKDGLQVSLPSCRPNPNGYVLKILF